MKHWKKTADGREIEEKIEDHPKILSPEEIKAQISGGGGGGTHDDHEDDRAIPPAQGPEVDIDQHWPTGKLPETPRGQGWLP